jgi:hypothetical protein
VNFRGHADLLHLQPRYENSVAKPLSDFTTPAYQKTACMRRHKAISQAVRLKTTRNTCFGTTSILAPPCKMAMKVSPMNRRFPERHTEQMRQDVHQQLMPVGRKAGRTEPIYGKPVFSTRRSDVRAHCPVACKSPGRCHARGRTGWSDRPAALQCTHIGHGDAVFSMPIA